VDGGYPPGTLSLSQRKLDLAVAWGRSCGSKPLKRIRSATHQISRASKRNSGSPQSGQATRCRGAQIDRRTVRGWRCRVPASEACQTFQQLKALIEQQGHLRLTAETAPGLLCGPRLEEARRLGAAGTISHRLRRSPISTSSRLIPPCFDRSCRFSVCGVPIVLLHMGYPYVRESAFLASLYPDVHVRSLADAPLLRPVLPHLLQELLALCPGDKAFVRVGCPFAAGDVLARRPVWPLVAG
jgi:hypothetical protein